MSPDFKNYKTMGVINVTPNSFSDPSRFFQTDALVSTLKENLHRSDLIFDFGFESTAPMNASITENEEKARFDSFFELIKEVNLNDRWISFDTYRPSSFRYFEECFKSRYKNQGFIFNDVSGVIDEELHELLLEKKCDQNFRYVYSYTHIPSRSETGKHMTFVHEGDILRMALDKFKVAEDKFSSWEINHNIIFDPCFGFSKSYEQNWDLLNRFSLLRKEFDLNRSWLLGISKKSFLRKSLPEGLSDPFAHAEKLHKDILAKLLKENSGHLFFRVHDFNIVKKAMESAYA